VRGVKAAWKIYLWLAMITYAGVITGSIRYFTFRHQRKSVKAESCEWCDVMFFMTGLVPR
jgi:hypothetical protein